MKRFSKENGFSIIELMMVVACVGILASVALPQLNSYRVRVRNAVTVSNLRNVISSQEVYFTDHEYYSDTITDLITYAGLRVNDDVWLETASGPDVYAFLARGIHSKVPHVGGGNHDFGTMPGDYRCFAYTSSDSIFLAYPRNHARHCASETVDDGSGDGGGGR